MAARNREVGCAVLQLDLLPAPLALLQLPAGSPVPEWAAAARYFLTVTRTPTELSIVADAEVVPGDAVAERAYRAFRVRGPLPLHLVGVLAAVAVPLADAGVSIFPIATYDTDYVLVKEADVVRARDALLSAGHQVAMLAPTDSFDRQPVLRGAILELRPLRADDFAALFHVAADPLIWEQHPERNRYQEATFRAFFEEALASGGALVAVDRATGRIIGSSRYHGYDAERSVIEVGWSFLARAYWGGRYNGEMKRLMLEHAFKTVKRVIFLIGPENRRSQRAVEKIGAARAGTTTNAQGKERVMYELTPALYARGQRSDTV